MEPAILVATLASETPKTVRAANKIRSFSKEIAYFPVTWAPRLQSQLNFLTSIIIFLMRFRNVSAIKRVGHAPSLIIYKSLANNAFVPSSFRLHLTFVSRTLSSVSLTDFTLTE